MMEKPRRSIGCFTIALGVALAAPAFAQAPDGRTAVTAEDEELAHVRTNRSDVVAEILDRWGAHLPAGNAALNLASGRERLAAALRSARAEQLLAADRAQSEEELWASLSAARAELGVIPLEPGRPIPNTLGSTTGDLVFTPLTPCRIVDTRFASGALAGRIGPNAGKQFEVNLGNYSAQGGNAGTCGLGFNVEAVAINVTSTDQTGPGNLRVVETGGGVPTVSLLNYTPGVNLANAAVVRARDSGAADIFIYSGVSSSHVVVDLMGYFTAPQATALDCVTNVVDVPLAAGVGQTGTGFPSCPAGYVLTGAGAYEPFGSNSIIINKLEFQTSTQVFCRLTNNTAGAVTADCEARCCRVPGR
jgi:hypothetical protein